MRRLRLPLDERVLVGFGTNDDAGVYQLSDDLAIVQTVDFFTPIVDDAFDFGRIAAANALSDVYAMGARPITALNIAAFPEDLPLDVLERVLAGGAEIATEAGVALLGGHTIVDDEPKYGMAVTGLVHPAKIITNAGARPGDALFLTKPLGTGVLATALKRGAIGEVDFAPAAASMTRLNRHASSAMIAAGASAATDVTGYGLLGHARELALASGVRLELQAAAVPVLANVRTLVERGLIPGGSKANAALHAGFTEFGANIDAATRVILSDAQTSGGLLIAVAPERAALLQSALHASGTLDAQIGWVTDGDGISVA